MTELEPKWIIASTIATIHLEVGLVRQNQYILGYSPTLEKWLDDQLLTYVTHGSIKS